MCYLPFDGVLCWTQLLKWKAARWLNTQPINSCLLSRRTFSFISIVIVLLLTLFPIFFLRHLECVATFQCFYSKILRQWFRWKLSLTTFYVMWCMWSQCYGFHSRKTVKYVYIFNRKQERLCSLSGRKYIQKLR